MPDVMKKFFLSLVFIVSVLFSFAQATFFEDAGKFFNKYVEEGLVDYGSVRKYPASLDALVTQISRANLKGMDKDTKKAFLINAYNILVIKTVVKNEPMEGPLKLEGFFDKIKHNVAGKPITLNQLENDYIRKVYNDARVHFVLVCGALGCPRISNYAYTPDRIESKLDQLTRKALNDNTFIRVDDATKTASISQIFEWYKGDFIAEAANLTEYINKYRGKKIPVTYKVNYYQYDWNSNGKKKK